MYQKRTLDEWVRKSFKISGVKNNPHLSIDFQSLGRMDLQLSHDWEIISQQLENPEKMFDFSHHVFLSRLWTIGGYELLRYIDFDKNEPTAEEKATHELFRRLRIPLVKYVKADSRGGIEYADDFGIAQLALSNDKTKLGWALNSNYFVSRDELAQALYDMV